MLNQSTSNGNGSRREIERLIFKFVVSCEQGSTFRSAVNGEQRLEVVLQDFSLGAGLGCRERHSVTTALC